MKHAETKYYFISIIYLAVLFFVLNFYFSQKISPIYFRLINGDRKAVVLFLQRIQNLPSFSFFLESSLNNFDHKIENEVYADQISKKKNIVLMTELLKRNPKSRDILYRLYLLNNDMGNTYAANEYLKMAREIDPNIK